MPIDWSPDHFIPPHATTAEAFDAVAKLVVEEFGGDSEIRDAAELHRASWTVQPIEKAARAVYWLGHLVEAIGHLERAGEKAQALVLRSYVRSRLLSGQLRPVD